MLDGTSTAGTDKGIIVTAMNVPQEEKP